MPKGVYKRTKSVWNKGKKGLQSHSIEHRLRLKTLNSGANNPFYGKKHTKEANEKNRSAHLGKKQSAKTIEKRIAQFRGSKHYLWKGDNAGYRAIHVWIETKLGKPRFCENCGARNLKHRQYQWSNIDHTYKRILKDWRRLCAKCHSKLDRSVGLI